MTRFVVDCETLLRIAAGEIEVSAEHKLVAPTLVRSQALSALYEAARRGEITRAEGLERVRRIAEAHESLPAPERAGRRIAS